MLRRFGRAVIPTPGYAVLSDFYNFAVGTRRLGRAEYLRLLRLRADRHAVDGDLSVFRLPNLLHPIAVRNGTSDPNELIHTVVRETYAPHSPSPDSTRLVIDAGANIGDTCSWFLTRYPSATVIALEPDKSNYAMLKRNCEAYGPRAVLLNAGLWPTRARLKVVESDSHNGMSVTEVGDGAAFDCESYSPTDLIALGGRDRIDLIKIDIEGAEAELFSAPCDAWLERTRVLMIEIHGPDAERAVRAAVGRHRFKQYRHREVHLFINRTIG
jgi:FkbM family methyltransferase